MDYSKKIIVASTELELNYHTIANNASVDLKNNKVSTTVKSYQDKTKFDKNLAPVKVIGVTIDTKDLTTKPLTTILKDYFDVNLEELVSGVKVEE